jgi:hypothetical protein
MRSPRSKASARSELDEVTNVAVRLSFRSTTVFASTVSGVTDSTLRFQETKSGGPRAHAYVAEDVRDAPDRPDESSSSSPAAGINHRDDASSRIDQGTTGTRPASSSTTS